jgi:hypothetical protein
MSNNWVNAVMTGFLVAVCMSVWTYVSREIAQASARPRPSLWGRWEYLLNVIGGVLVAVAEGFHHRFRLVIALIVALLVVGEISKFLRRRYLRQYARENATS